MSGGHFDYNQYHIEQIADDIEEEINGHELDGYEVQEYIRENFLEDNEAEYVRKNKHTIPAKFYYSKETVAEFRKAVRLLRKAYVYVQRIDWLLSGDDGEDNFHSRLKEDLEELKNKKI